MKEEAPDDVLQRGKRLFSMVFGPDYGSELAEQLHDPDSEFNSIVMGEIAPLVWERPALDVRSKVLCCIAMFTVLHREEVKFFVRAAAYHGVSTEQIEEVILLAGLEGGFPAANAARRWMKEALAEHEEFVSGIHGKDAGGETSEESS